MKYGESIFDIIYLTFAIAAGIYILRRRKDQIGKIMGSAVLILGCGDAFHLIPRVLNYFANADFTAWLGFGKLVTSLTMTVFYVLMYRLWLCVYGEQESKQVKVTIYAFSIVRIILCLVPQNRWLANESSVMWGIIRNIPFVCIGVIVICIYYRNRAKENTLRSVWMLVALSFLFYIPVAVGAGAITMLGMLMLPKTVCYMILICIFIRYAGSRTAKN